MDSQQSIELLEASVSATEQLIQLMLEERDALANHQIDTLNKITQDKIPVLETLGHYQQQLETLITLHQFSFDHAGLEAYIKQYIPTEQQPVATKRWEQLQANLQQCQHLNRVNGRVLHITNKNMRELEKILFNITPEDRTQSYSPSGIAETQHVTRDIDQA
ncbi:MAG: hypothetical protein Tsb005_09550 [Gammaproteobacteria bacterium]